MRTKSFFLFVVLLSFCFSQAQVANYQWAGRIGTTFAEANPNIICDAAGNTYIVSSFLGTVDVDMDSVAVYNLTSTGGSYDMYVSKYNSNGIMLWAFSVGGNGTEFPASITLDASGNIMIAGTFGQTVDMNPDPGIINNLTPAGQNDVFVAKYNSQGQYINAFSFGGTDFENATGIDIDASGNIIVTGSFKLTADFNPDPGSVNNLTSAGGDDIYFAKYTSAGSYIWAYRIGSTNNDVVASVNFDVAGNLVFTGHFTGTVDFNPDAGTTNNLTSAGGNDIYLAKYNNDGIYQWAFSAGSNAGFTGSDIGRSVTTDALNNVIMTGFFQGTVDFDPGPGSVTRTASGAGDCFIAKYNSNGIIQWAMSVGSNNNTFGEEGYGVCTDGNNNIIVTGSIWGNTNMNPFGAAYILAPVAQSDIFVSKYSPAGLCQWAFSAGGVSNDAPGYVITDSYNNIIVSGTFRAGTDFNPDPNVANILFSNGGERDGFVGKYGPCGLLSLANTAQSITQSINNSFFYTIPSCNNLVTKLIPRNPNPVNGNVTAKVWMEAGVQSYAGDPYVQRHYEITPSAGSAARVTLYFTQAEFSAFNANAGSILDLPLDGTDAAGYKSNLRILGYPGASNDGSGRPESYSGTATLIDPLDNNIIWNVTSSRWEVTFNANNPGGFIAGTFTSINLCPLNSFVVSAADTGTVYQWQINTGSGFANINDNVNYSGTATPNLLLQSIPTGFYGYQYRCLINGVATPAHTLKFSQQWEGAADTDWHNPVNWGGCNTVPDQFTDVYIPAGKSRYPVLNVNAAVRSIRAENGSSLIIQNGVSLNITGF